MYTKENLGGFNTRLNLAKGISTVNEKLDGKLEHHKFSEFPSLTPAFFFFLFSPDGHGIKGDVSH